MRPPFESYEMVKLEGITGRSGVGSGFGSVVVVLVVGVGEGVGVGAGADHCLMQ